MKKILPLTLFFLCVVAWYSLALDTVKEISVLGEVVAVDDTFDVLLSKIPRKFLVQESIEVDPEDRSKNLFTQDYSVKEKAFRVVIGFSQGEYRVRDILLNLQAPTAKPPDPGAIPKKTNAASTSKTQGKALSGCNSEAASRVLASTRQMASLEDQADRLTVRWGADWSYANRDQMLALVHAVADADACLTGEARPIFFYYLNKQVGKADPIFGVKLFD